MNHATKKAIAIIIIANFIICLGWSLVIPIGPFIKTQYHLTAADMGIMTSLFAFSQFIFSPIVGRLSDRIGRAPILTIGLLLYTISEFLFAAAGTLWLFDISRLIGGIAAAMVGTTSMALAADLSSERDRARVIGWLSASFSGGLILGPGLGGVLANVSYKTPFWVAGTAGIIAAIVFVFGMPSHLKHHSRGAVADPSIIRKGRLNTILTKPLVALFLMILIASFGLAGFESIYTIYVNQVFKFTLNEIALVMILNGIFSLILQVILFDRLVRWFTEIGLTRLCFLISTAGIVWILLTQQPVSVIVATLFIFCAFDILRPAITTLLTRFGQNQQGLINGINVSLTSIGNIIGPIFAGSLMDINPHIPYTIVAIILFISALMTWLVQHELSIHAPRQPQ
ncbi:MFS transporter [Fructilactobacillus florum]|uniref:Multidrug resistance protein 1 n=1 Tax=Fructilactobacillus florum DSM 22689 = JCM 16035 TaxID=1423745 RepID=A0A0R2CMQ7_9LACO|nr:MFS transporter [Fructilactobacillus florum]KRM91252.1 multidrug resistance protein 1 [Fructilactobacillus florum DSM 22689 = JCM 16035]